MDARLSPCALSAYTYIRRTIVSLMRRWLDTVAICFVGHRTQRRRMPSTRTPLNLRFMLERDFNDSLSPRHRNDSFSTNFFWEWRIHFHLFSCSQPFFPPSFSTTVRSCLFDFPFLIRRIDFFHPVLATNPSLELEQLELLAVNFWSGKPS